MEATRRAATRRLSPALPWLLIGLRFTLGPATFLVSGQRHPVEICAILILAMLSDLFDGVIARRLRTVTDRLRVADSWVDAWFFIWVGASVWVSHPEIVHAYIVPISIEIGIQIVSYAFDLIRYRRIASLHAYSAKVWAVSLYVAAIGVLAFGHGVLIWVAFGFGILSTIDAFAIKLLIPGWKADVLSTFHALAERRLEP